MNSQQEQLPPPPKSIEDLLTHLNIYATRLGAGKQAIAYRFKPFLEGFDQFIIRIPFEKAEDRKPSDQDVIDKIKKELLSSSSLTPPGHIIPASRIVSKINIGNRLMELQTPLPQDQNTLKAESERISFHLAQEGENLNAWYMNKQQTYLLDNRDEPEFMANMRASIDVIHAIKEVVETKGFNPYVRMFKKAYALIGTGIEPDIALKNILYSKEKMTLRMVDQENRFLEKPIESEKETVQKMRDVARDHLNEFDWNEAIKKYKGDYPPGLLEEYKACFSYMQGLFHEAFIETIRSDPGRDKPDASGMPAIPRTVEFSSVESSQAVAIDKPPQALLLQLQHIVKTADICR